ncbi:MAG: ABC transporter substrate-binding protein [bacterium]|nr:ABC transporter substrate-binding protein [bacterium]
MNLIFKLLIMTTLIISIACNDSQDANRGKSGSAKTSAQPPITGSPTLTKTNGLAWPKDFSPNSNGSDLAEPTANRVFDLHGEINKADIAVTTAGNYHMALREMWHDHYLKKYAKKLAINNWFYTTSPPIAVSQVRNKEYTVDNFRSQYVPLAAIGPKGLMKKLQAQKLVMGEPEAVIQNQGNVLLVAKNNPKKINKLGDLYRDDMKMVISNKDTEPGSFGNYSGSIFNIANQNPGQLPTGVSAVDFFNKIFNTPNEKWISGHRIHHREVPQAIADGEADCGMMFYHLAKYAVDSFPGKFDIVPLGGSVSNPDPLPGNKIGKLFIVRIKRPVTFLEYARRELLIKEYLSKNFTSILKKYGLKRPDTFAAKTGSIKASNIDRELKRLKVDWEREKNH